MFQPDFKSMPSAKAGELIDKFPGCRVLVVGDVIHDVFIWGKVRRISPEAPVPVVEVTRETSLLGGAANVVSNVQALGARARLAGVVGDDAAGQAVIEGLDAIGADSSLMVKSSRRPTPVKTRIIAHQQQVVRYDREQIRPLHPDTFQALVRSIEAAIKEVDAVIVSDYAKGTVSQELMSALTPLCDKNGILLALDPKPAHADWYQGVSFLTPNNKEASQMAGIEIETGEDLDRAGKAILDRLRCKGLLITRGEKGMSLFRPTEETVHVPALAREVYDVTGAGDTVIAAFTVAAAAGMDTVDAVRTANLAAGIVVGKLGTSVATRQEIGRAISREERD